MLRLCQARRALLSVHDHVVTVTKIATGFGFAELGRFSVEYRKPFGDASSRIPLQINEQSCRRQI